MFTHWLLYLWRKGSKYPFLCVSSPTVLSYCLVIISVLCCLCLLWSVSCPPVEILDLCNVKIYVCMYVAGCWMESREENTFLPLPRKEVWFLGLSARSLVTMPRQNGLVGILGAGDRLMQIALHVSIKKAFGVKSRNLEECNNEIPQCNYAKHHIFVSPVWWCFRKKNLGIQTCFFL
jgi:hypothetical protein